MCAAVPLRCVVVCVMCAVLCVMCAGVLCQLCCGVCDVCMARQMQMKVRWKTEATQKAALGAVNMRLTADNSDPHTMTGRQEVSVGKVLVKRKLDRKVHFDEASFGGDSTYRAFCAVDVLAEATGVSITQWQQRIRRVAHLLATDMVQNLTHINLKERPVKGATLNIVQAAVQNCLEMYESSFSGRWWQEEEALEESLERGPGPLTLVPLGSEESEKSLLIWSSGLHSHQPNF